MTIEERLDAIEKSIQAIDAVIQQQTKLESVKSEWMLEVTDTIKKLTDSYEYLANKVTGGKLLS